jgi:hypothetical protein
LSVLTYGYLYYSTIPLPLQTISIILSVNNYSKYLSII